MRSPDEAETKLRQSRDEAETMPRRSRSAISPASIVASLVISRMCALARILFYVSVTSLCVTWL